jgi:hypothetical protein
MLMSLDLRRFELFHRLLARIAVLLTVCMLELSAAAQFETRANFNVKPSVPSSITVGDFNRDGDLDVAVVSSLPAGSVAILFGNGDGTFRTGATYAVGVQPEYAATVSFRKNGILDLVVGDSLSDDVYVMLGNGDGTFQAPVSYPTSGEPFVVGTGDFTGDGKLDIIALTQPAAECDCIEVLPGNGDGTFGAALITPVPYGIDGFALTTGDFNGDKKVDVAVTGQFFGANQVDILLGNGDGTFAANGFYDVSLSPNSIVAADLTGTNKLDLAIGVDPGIQILLGNGDGTFQSPVLYPTNFPQSIVAEDLNGDGKLDLAVSNPHIEVDSSGISVFTGNGDGTFQPAVFYPAGDSVSYVAAGDLNDDGKPDLAAVDVVGEATITLLNTGAAIFSPTTPLGSRGQLIGTTSAPIKATLTNSGTTAMNISSVTCNGQPFRVTETTCKGSLVPGAQCSITAQFTPKTKGYVTGTITLKDSASSKAQVVELVGTGTVVELSPPNLTFGPQKVGTSSPPQTFRLTNTGSAALNLAFIQIEDNNKNYFSQSNNCGSRVAPRASCAITIIFSPRKTGVDIAHVKLTDDGGASPQLVPLTGTGD